MEIIRQSNQQLLKWLGPNIMDNSKNHRLIKYLLIEDYDNGKAIYNDLTRSFIWIPDTQFNDIYNTDRSIGYINWLWENYFIVNEDYNEEIAQWKLKENQMLNPDHPSYLANGNITNYTIFSTMACNARCAYCYEIGRPQTPMTADTARKVGDYIIKSAAKDGRTINLNWFGGEPLVGEHCIDIICQKLKDAGFKYKSNFTSNAFLFKKEKSEKYRDLWHINSAQITLDGIGEDYNRIKNYKNVKGKNPYQIVMNNIKFLSQELNVYISIRINMTLENKDKIPALIHEIYNNFGVDKNVTLYCYPVFDTDDPRTPEENEILFGKLKECEELTKQLGYLVTNKFRNDNVCWSHCMCDNGHSVVISTQGDIGLCEHYSEDEFFGHIDNPDKKDMDMIKSFHEYVRGEEVCSNCQILPSCLIPLKCHDLRHCNIWKREWRTYQAHYEVERMYKDYKIRKEQDLRNNNRNNCNNNCNNNNCNNNCNNTPVVEEKKYNKFLDIFRKILIYLGIK